MANAKEIVQIIENTPINQPVMLEGIHGIGKSEVVKEYFERKGFRVVILFLGQLSDSSDLLGLPQRREEIVNGKPILVTDFCPPAWFPLDEDEKCILFLDELNRAKPEILQVVMDLVLNRKLYNRNLPKNTRIVSAVNPLNDGVYQVEEVDPALLDRFNKYEFNPTVDEWIDWGSRNKVHNRVLGFISRHNDHLDPPHANDYKPGVVSPSRRSWKKVSDLINGSDLLENNVELLKTSMLGIVGDRSVSAFGKYLREVSNGIHAGSLLTSLDEKMEKIIKSMSVQDFIHLNKEIIHWFNSNSELIKESNDTSIYKYTYNLERYLNMTPIESNAEFFSLLGEAHQEKQEWAKKILIVNKQLANKMFDAMSGNDEEDEKLKENLK